VSVVRLRPHCLRRPSTSSGRRTTAIPLGSTIRLARKSSESNALSKRAKRARRRAHSCCALSHGEPLPASLPVADQHEPPAGAPVAFLNL